MGRWLVLGLSWFSEGSFTYLKRMFRRLTRYEYKSLTDSWKKSRTVAAVNSFFGRLIISSNANQFAFPLTHMPFRHRKMEKKLTKDNRIYLYHHGNEWNAEKEKSGFLEGRGKFEFIYKFIECRLEKDERIFDVGCNTGIFLGILHDKGFNNLYGLDPMAEAVQWAHTEFPYLMDTVKQGFFGPRKLDVHAEFITFIDSADRVPYSAGLFEAIDRCALEYVLIAGSEIRETFPRNWVSEMARKGFVCIEKQTVNGYGVPIGRDGNRGAQIETFNVSVFRRLEPITTITQ